MHVFTESDSSCIHAMHVPVPFPPYLWANLPKHVVVAAHWIGGNQEDNIAILKDSDEIIESSSSSDDFFFSFM